MMELPTLNHESVSQQRSKTERASSLLRALAHPLRIKIINYISEQKKVNVFSIYTNLQIEQSITSQHLRILRDEELVLTERQGKFIFYKINTPLINRVNRVICSSFGE